MSQVSRPMQIALGATVLFMLVWFVALRPKPTTEDGTAAPTEQTAPAAPGTEGLNNAVDKAQDAVTTANDAAERAAGNGTDDAPSTGGAAADEPGATDRASTPTPGSAVRARRAAAASNAEARSVRAALRHHKAVAIAFIDPHTADSGAVAAEVRAASRFGGRALTLAVPLTELSDYGFITREVEVTVAPTVVIVDRKGRATTIVGFTDRVEIEQRLADALAARR